MAKRKSSRNEIVGVRFSTEERASVEKAAELLSLSLSDYLRKVALATAPRPVPAQAVIADVKPVDESGVIDCSRSWREEFKAMKGMPPAEAQSHLVRLLAGRKFPPEFVAMSPSARIEWLDEHYTLGAA